MDSFVSSYGPDKIETLTAVDNLPIRSMGPWIYRRLRSPILAGKVRHNLLDALDIVTNAVQKAKITAARPKHQVEW